MKAMSTWFFAPSLLSAVVPCEGIARPEDGKLSSRVEIDVLLRGTDADPAKTFRLYFDRMKKKAIDFRKAIGFS